MTSGLKKHGLFSFVLTFISHTDGFRFSNFHTDIISLKENLSENQQLGEFNPGALNGKTKNKKQTNKNKQKQLKPKMTMLLLLLLLLLLLSSLSLSLSLSLLLLLIYILYIYYLYRFFNRFFRG